MYSSSEKRSRSSAKVAISPEGYEKAVWQSCGPARSVVVVEVNGYTIEPGADLAGADLEDADLSGANLYRTRLNSATADEFTTWPKSFDPEAAGVIFR